MIFQLDKHYTSVNKGYLLQQGNTCSVPPEFFLFCIKSKGWIIDFPEEKILQDRHALKVTTLLSLTAYCCLTKATGYQNIFKFVMLKYYRLQGKKKKDK